MSPVAPHRRADSKSAGDRLTGVGCLLAIGLPIAIDLTATIAVGNNPLRPDRVLANAVSAPGDADDYVEGLARLGIARLPCLPGALPSTRSQACSQHGR
jgi:hypothetical protein